MFNLSSVIIKQVKHSCKVDQVRRCKPIFGLHGYVHQILRRWRRGTLLICSLLTACYVAPEQELAEICHPTDPACAAEDFDKDGVPNGQDDFPLDGSCSKQSRDHCSACGQGCAPTFYCMMGQCLPVEAERCDGVDNDRDDVVDEELTPPPAQVVSGVCQGLSKRCSGEEGWVDPALDALPHYQEEESLCDGLDNDCDGRIDERLSPPLADPQRGICMGATLQCEGEAGWVGPDWRRYSDSFELEELTCDGLDNDCDGSIDERVDGQPCQTGNEGQCAAGLTRCVEGTLRCEMLSGIETETCNAIDEDCDGKIDELLSPPLDPEGLGVCRSPLAECEGGQWSLRPVEQIPTYEVVEVSCDGLDNDCDGFTDEGVTISPCQVMNVLGPCSVGRLLCQGGSLTCVSDHIVDQEQCDGVDNDCDGGVDEDVLLPQFTHQRGVCVGLQSTCEGERGIIEADPTRLFEYEAIEVSCDGLDNDCDGVVDEAIASSICVTRLAGECGVGETSCVEGIVLCRSPLPQDELCDGLDNDCDGGVDEQLTPPLTPLTEGVCSGEVQRCDGQDGWQTPPPSPAYESVEVSCDGLDNDCDGRTDEGGLQQPDPNPLLRGVCRAQQLVCVEGNWVEPTQADVTAQLPSYQVEELSCDQLDNDCDGQVDEQPADGWSPCLTGLSGRCEQGISRCVAGELSCEPLIIPELEQCNGEDDDCDGLVDEGLIAGECSLGQGRCAAVGQVRCVTGQFICQAEPTLGTDERCNAVDDDCDGKIDEVFALSGLTCSKGVGACERQGTWRCDLGELSCDAIEGAAIEERCDGIDNDCDGEHDEDFFNLARPCIAGIGACEVRGIWRCGDTGELQCADGEPSPQLEQCDGIDNDCDGFTDEHSQVEQCDLIDNDCDGLVDEAVFDEVCNLEDDDCDGMIDESPCAPCLTSTELCPEFNWTVLPGGDYLMGGTREDETPLHSVQLARFELSDEVTVDQYQTCVRAGACSPAGSGGDCNASRADRAHYPINCISWLQAHQFAYWVGGRLPTESEWEYAARGAGQDILTPWGDDEASCEEALLRDENGFGCGLNESTGVRDPRHSAGVSPQGLWDLLGNVSEWVEDDYIAGYIDAPQDGHPRCDVGGCAAQGDKVIRGGGWRSDVSTVDNRSRTAAFYLLKSADLGFRVARYGRSEGR